MLAAFTPIMSLNGISQMTAAIALHVNKIQCEVKQASLRADFITVLSAVAGPLGWTGEGRVEVVYATGVFMCVKGCQSLFWCFGKKYFSQWSIDQHVSVFKCMLPLIIALEYSWSCPTEWQNKVVGSSRTHSIKRLLIIVLIELWFERW